MCSSMLHARAKSDQSQVNGTPHNAPLISAILLSIALTGSALAQSAAPAAPSLVSPGMWEIMPQSSQSATVSYRQCFARGDLDDLKALLPNLRGGTACPAAKLETNAGVMTWSLDCPAKSFRGDGRYELQAAAVRGTINFIDGADNKTTTLTIAAHYTGPCPQP